MDINKTLNLDLFHLYKYLDSIWFKDATKWYWIFKSYKCIWVQIFFIAKRMVLSIKTYKKWVMEIHEVKLNSLKHCMDIVTIYDKLYSELDLKVLKDLPF